MKALMLQHVASKIIRKWCLGIFLAAILSGISWLFWVHELKYQLPTPVPPDYKEVKPGTPIALTLPFTTIDSQKPVFLHFFNPDCPCSRFNMKHFKELVKKYGKDVQFAIVAMVSRQRYTAADIQEKFDLELPISFDTALATTCGVYSTLQAVIIEKNKLYFRGNYNKSRYCTDPKSNYAQMALDSLLNHQNAIRIDPAALKAYGCELPTCKK